MRSVLRVFLVVLTTLANGCTDLSARFEGRPVLEEMIAHNNWADIPAGQLSDALVSLCALRVTDQRHYWIDKLEWDAHLRVNCLGDERYTKESRGRVRYLDGFWTDNECSSPVNLPGVESGGVASLCEVKQHRIIP